jgi:hypothetical protein
VRIDETPTPPKLLSKYKLTTEASNIPAGNHTIVFNYYMAYADHTVSVYGLTITMNFEPGYEYDIEALESSGLVKSQIVKSDPTEWVHLAANESLLSIQRQGMASLRIYIDGKATLDFDTVGVSTRRVIIPNGKHTLSYATFYGKTAVGEQQGTTEIELTTSSSVVYGIKDGDKTFTKVDTP